MATLDDFYPYVLPSVPGCPDMTADLAIRSSLIEFCEKSLIIQRDHDPITCIQGVIDYDLEPPSGQMVTKVLRAWYKDTEITPIAPDNVGYASFYNTLATNPQSADPRHYIQKDERSITVYPYPKETLQNALTLRVALKPSRRSSSFEDVLFEDYAEAISDGAKYRLMTVAGAPWADPQAAAICYARFNASVNVARTRAISGSTRGNVRVHLTGV